MRVSPSIYFLASASLLHAAERADTTRTAEGCTRCSLPRVTPL